MYSLIFTNNKGQSIDFSKLADSHIIGVSGLEPTDAEISEFTTPTFDGVNFANIKRGKRNVIINIAQKGINNAEVRKQIYRVVGGKQKGVFRYVDNTLDVFTSAIVESITPTQWTNAPILQVSILCERAFFYSTELKKTRITRITPLLEFPLELTEQGQEFGRIESENNMIIINNGDEITPCKITLDIIGSVSNPIVSNNAIGGYFSLFGDFHEGQKIVIETETGKKSAKVIDVDNRERDLFNSISISSTWLYIDVGQNQFVISAESGIDNIVANIEYREIFYGVD